MQSTPFPAYHLLCSRISFINPISCQLPVDFILTSVVHMVSIPSNHWLCHWLLVTKLRLDYGVSSFVIASSDLDARMPWHIFPSPFDSTTDYTLPCFRFRSCLGADGWCMGRINVAFLTFMAYMVERTHLTALRICAMCIYVYRAVFTKVNGSIDSNIKQTFSIIPYRLVKIPCRVPLEGVKPL